MKHLHLPVALLIAGLACLAAPAVRPAGAAPPAPGLLQTLSPRELAALPREPAVPAGVTRAAGAGTSGRNRTGHPRILVILVDFDDRPADPSAHPPAFYRRMLFGHDEADTVSLRDYYLEASYGRFDVTGEVVGWYRMPHPYDYYPGGYSGLCTACFPHNARSLAADAVRAAVDDGVDFTRFDNDGLDGVPGSGDDDGILDGLLVVYPEYGAERTGRLTDLRSHYWSMTAMTQVGSIAVPDYAMFSGQDNVGVAIHEFGHVLGGEDLYDTSVQGNGLGVYSVMAYGMWLVDATHPSGPDPYTRIEWGFVEPVNLLADDPDLDVPAVEDEPFVLRLWTRGETGPEYFLVENRRPTGIDGYLPADGLLVYHVDTTVRSQNDPRRYRVGLVEADGRRSLEGEFPRNLGEAGDAFPGALGVTDLGSDTRPDTRAHDGSATGVTLRRIGRPGAAVHAWVGVDRYLGRDPVPRMQVVPAGGLLADLPGGGARVRLRVTNLGSLLPAGTLRLVPAARLELSGPGSIPVEALDAFHTLETDTLWTARVRSGAPAGGAPVLLEAVWEASGRSYDLAAPVPTEASVRGREGFEAESATVLTAAVREGSPQTWTRQHDRAADGVWAYRARAVPGWFEPAGADAGLVLGPYEISGEAELRFRQFVSTRSYGAYAVDGGFLEVSTDGGASWRILTPDGGYPTTFAEASGNHYPGLPAWSGNTGTWESVRVPLTGIEGPARFRFHFAAAFGEDTSDLYEGWTVDDVVIRGWDPPYAASLEAAPEEGRVRFGIHVRPALGGDVAGEVRLMRERAGETVLLAVIPFRRRRDLTEWAADAGSADPASYWLEWGTDPVERTSPVVLRTGSPPSGALLAGTPSVVHERGGGWISYRTDTDGPVTLDLYDVRGRRIARLAEGDRGPGTYRVSWPARGGDGRALGSGVYFLRLLAGAEHESRRVTLLP